MAFRCRALGAPLFLWVLCLSLCACSSDDTGLGGDGSVPSEDDGGGDSDLDAEVDGDVQDPADGGLPDADLSPGGDADGDGVPNESDNCRLAANTDQRDYDGDFTGDACDNCARVANADQADANRDGVGDVCQAGIFADGDEDGDGLRNNVDKCIFVADPGNADSDGDGVGDACDNCKGIGNTKQADADMDGIGDACEDGAALMDSDGDGLPDANDNCPTKANVNQADADKDLVGDACDNCPAVANYNQKNSDDDVPAVGDLCEDDLTNPNADFDGDGVKNGVDNCPLLTNANQADLDKDKVGDACDNCKAVANADQRTVPDPTKCMVDVNADTDGDGVKDTGDNCPSVKNANQADQDNDKRGDACDNCPRMANYAQKDSNNDGVGDACATLPDRDNDTVPDARDNCIATANTNQADGDKDGAGDACDNCPTVANPGQADSDNNKKGDACDTNNLPPANTCAEATTQANPIRPNLYFLLDRSDSMGRSAGSGLGTRIAALKAGLDALAGTDMSPGAIVRNFQTGMGAFPRNWSCNLNDLPVPLLPMATRSAGQFRTGYASMSVEGFTPTDLALARVRTQQLYNLSGDTLTTRPKAVVLITDGSPNQCMADDDSRVAQTVAEAVKLAKARIPVYVLGFTGIDKDAIMAAIAYGGNPTTAANLPSEACSPSRQTNCICASGSNCIRYQTLTGTWYPVNSSTSITQALNGIISRTVSCTLPVTPAAGRTVDPATARVRFINGATNKLLARGTEYAIAGTTVTLLGSACTALQEAVVTNPEARVEVDLGCACTPDAAGEICGNGKDDDCDGRVDEDCYPTDNCAPGSTDPKCVPTDTPPEVCNGKDDDGDGQVDEGCESACKLPSAPEVCDGDDNDCDGEVDEDCPPACVPAPEICNGKDDDCDQIVDEGCEPACTPFTELCQGDEAAPDDLDCDGDFSRDEPGCITCTEYTNEICDYKDNDCDGQVDEGCPSTVI